ncbi:conserved hypothetical protein [Gloeothece citriformis PCC 7424]|uniref:Nucleoside phosphorylase domain-containing protein n=1 Tax=Gloeothece citriformis (strain PCC 7424) TaxID=65393 RepID=B7K7F6_GLOC7|nr:hypothetical protein [Gloeothece citriformis]ACK69724.1 conserved hypothetical protein [Gloeothece citriformis PCC 7424]
MINPINSKLDVTQTEKNIDVILVPQGAEYQAVCRGLKAKTSLIPKVIPIPIGCQSHNIYLQNLQQSTDFLNKPPQTVLLMGLCGGLSSSYHVGDTVIYAGCGYAQPSEGLLWQECDRPLVTLLQTQLQDKAKLVKGLTSDRLIWLASEKQKLYQQYGMEVVDMEGFTALSFFRAIGVNMGIIRVISDESKQNLPDLTSAISADGVLKPFPLAVSMLQHPLAATQLIQGSLKGLGVLEKITRQLFGGGRGQ